MTVEQPSVTRDTMNRLFLPIWIEVGHEKAGKGRGKEKKEEERRRRKRREKIDRSGRRSRSRSHRSKRDAAVD
jgi:hypothetical protein